MKRIMMVLLLGVIPAASAYPQSRTSANYSIGMECIDTGGIPASSANYTLKPSLGPVGRIQENGSPVVLMQTGYAGQLFEVESLVVATSPGSINEGASSQLSATVNYDDGTYIQPVATAVTWARVSGPVDPPTMGGSVSALLVYQNEVATVSGSYSGETDNELLTILNSNPDNYLDYGGDGMDDDWQVGYFGPPPNSDADPSENPDGDADPNYMEFLTGFDPTDPTQWFQVIIMDCDGVEAQLQLNKVIPGRTYTIEAGTDLVTFAETVTTLNPTVEELDKAVTDSSFSPDKKFYRVDVTKP